MRGKRFRKYDKKIALQTLKHKGWRLPEVNFQPASGPGRGYLQVAKRGAGGGPGGQKECASGLVRVDLMLPADHPLLRCPAGSRRAAAREWLDIGARLCAVEEKLGALDLIKERLDEVTERLGALEKKLAECTVQAGPAAPGGGQGGSSLPFDVVEFLKGFDF